MIAAGKFHEAYELIRENCPLPGVCGRICHHPCQGACNRKEIDEPIAVRDLKRFAADYVYEHRAEHPGGSLLEIAKLRPAVDKFFDKVMVMVDDDKLRANRLALLQTLVKEFSTIADFSEIVTEGKESPNQ